MVFDEGVQKNWKDHGVFLGNAVLVKQIDNFAKIIKGKVGIDETYGHFPGFVMHTGEESFQEFHLDLPGGTGNEWILHAPLCTQGMWLHVAIHIVEEEKTVVIPQKLRIPFGCYLLLRSSVVHSGICGSPGNIRFHMVFKPPHASGKKLYYVDENTVTGYPKSSEIDSTSVLDVIDEDPKFFDALNDPLTTAQDIKEFTGLVKFKDG